MTLNDFNIRSHFKHMTKTFLESLQSHWTIDPNYPELLKPFHEKEFIKSLSVMEPSKFIENLYS